ncbi:unnamed protein product, partial [Rotaria sordida]
MADGESSVNKDEQVW